MSEIGVGEGFEVKIEPLSGNNPQITLNMTEVAKEQTRKKLLEAQDDFGLSPKELGMILIGTEKAYDTYKKWITSGSQLRKPTLSVMAHLDTLYDYYRQSPAEFKQYLEKQLKAFSES